MWSLLTGFSSRKRRVDRDEKDVFLGDVVPVAHGNAVNGQEADGPKGR
jgi:hypothetical protein